MDDGTFFLTHEKIGIRGSNLCFHGYPGDWWMCVHEIEGALFTNEIKDWVLR